MRKRLNGIGKRQSKDMRLRNVISGFVMIMAGE